MVIIILRKSSLIQDTSKPMVGSRIYIAITLVIGLSLSLLSQDVLMFDQEVMRDSRVDNLRNINSPEMDFAPVYWKDLLVYVTNNREDLDVDRRINEKFFDLKYADRNATQGFERSAFFPSVINSPFHEGPCTFTSDGGVIYFTRDHQVRNRTIKNYSNIVPLQIYTSILNIDGWSEPELWEHSEPSALYAHPTLSETGDTLVFSSSRDGGAGKMDLYMSLRRGNVWTNPVALDTINTEGNEWFARFHHGYLFYSSDAKTDSGDLDIYVYDFASGRSQMLPSPINSGYDDFGFMIIDDTTAVYSSNRPGGVGKDDLYQFTTAIPMIRTEVANPSILTLNVRDQRTNSTVQGAELEMTTITDPSDIIKILLDNSESREILDTQYASTSISTASSQDGKIITQLKYPVLVKIDGYVPGYQDYSSVHYLESEQDLTILLVPEPRVVSRPIVTPPPAPSPPRRVMINQQEVQKGSILVFDNIYYVYDSDEIESSSLSELNGLAKAMRENPSIKVQLSAHTDSRGESLYNQLLSDKRAKSAKEYLTNNGISDSRIVAIGFGESRLRNQCDNGVDCTEDEHKFNRRTEVKILDY